MQRPRRQNVSAWSDYKAGLLTESEYTNLCLMETYRDGEADEDPNEEDEDDND